MTELEAEIERALEAMASGFNVQLITTFEPDLVFAPADVNAKDWLANNHPSFDQFPVRRGESTVGVLVRDEQYDDQTVTDAMLVLRDGIIVSTHMPIAELIPQLRSNHFRLVLRGGRIEGLVTQSDLLKLPVRILLFGLITHLEMLLRGMIRKRFNGDTWKDKLRRDALGGVNARHRKLQAKRLDPDILECLLFSDAVTILDGDPHLGPSFSSEMTMLGDFRNDVAHATTFINSPQEIDHFVGCFEGLRSWISRVATLCLTPV
jgi:hypothetical protein